MTDSSSHQPPVFTLGEAAKAAGVSKPTLSKAVSTGRLSAEKTPDGSYRIQAAELFRVYPPNRKGNGLLGGVVDGQETGKDNRLLDGEIDRLRERLATQDAERDRERRQLTDQIEDLRRRLDQEGEERRKLLAVLSDQRVKEQDTPPAQQKSLWARLTGRG
jgi:excisionase family DNA binding protein